MARLKLRLTFVLPFVNLTGGIKILFEHANRLAEHGHKVTIVYPGVLFHNDKYSTVNHSPGWRLIKGPLRQLKYRLFVSWLRRTEANWFPLDRRIVLKRTPDLSSDYIPEADIVIATASETVDWVHAYPANKGVQVNFAQDYEVWSRPTKVVDRTFSYTNMHLITIGNWQKKLFEEKFGRRVETVIPNGVDTKRFLPQTGTRKKAGPIRILMSYHHLAYKGIADGFYAYNEAKKSGQSVQLVLFGVHDLKPDVPKSAEYHRAIPEEELPDLYRSVDIFVWPSHREGFGLPPMEAMACGIPVVGTDAGAMPDYMKDGVTGFIVPIKQPKQLAEKLIILIKDKVRRQKMGAAAAQAMQSWDWGRQTAKLENYLLSLAHRG